MRLGVSCAVISALLSAAHLAGAADDDAPRLVAFPGASRAISHSMSASRDTALLGMQFFPYPAGTAGADFAVVAFHMGGWSTRAGLFGMLEVQSVRRWDMATTGVWRGLAGGSIAVSADREAEALLGERGKLEATLNFRHESEHVSAGTQPQFPLAGGISGDFLMPDLAARVPFGRLDLEVRAQLKVFLPNDELGELHGDDLYYGPLYTYGPGADVILRWRIHPRVHPFCSTFYERLFGREVEAFPIDRPWLRATVQTPDQYLWRTQLGTVLVFDPAPQVRTIAGELQTFLFSEVGHGDGVMRLREEVRIGLGMRGEVFR